MKTVNINKAQTIGPSGEIESVNIVIDNPVPEHRRDLSFEEMGFFFDKEANFLADALFKTLPQGTMDRLLIALMKRKLSLYIGPTNS